MYHFSHVFACFLLLLFSGLSPVARKLWVLYNKDLTPLCRPLLWQPLIKGQAASCLDKSNARLPGCPQCVFLHHVQQKTWLLKSRHLYLLPYKDNLGVHYRRQKLDLDKLFSFFPSAQESWCNACCFCRVMMRVMQAAECEVFCHCSPSGNIHGTKERTWTKVHLRKHLSLSWAKPMEQRITVIKLCVCL